MTHPSILVRDSRSQATGTAAKWIFRLALCAAISYAGVGFMAKSFNCSAASYAKAEVNAMVKDIFIYAGLRSSQS